MEVTVVTYTEIMVVIYMVVCIFFTSAMKTITSSFEGMSNQPTPRWVEPKVSNY